MGLGLAICKQIVDRYDESVGLSRFGGSGTFGSSPARVEKALSNVADSVG